MNEVNYFAKCPNFLKKYLFSMSVQKNPVVVVCIYYSFFFLKKIVFPFSEKKKKDWLQFIWKKRIGYNFKENFFKKNNSFNSK